MTFEFQKAFKIINNNTLISAIFLLFHPLPFQLLASSKNVNVILHELIELQLTPFNIIPSFRLA